MNILISYDHKGKRRLRSIEAKVVGPLAYHPTVDRGEFWTVTHVVTGRSITRWVATEREARSVATSLAALDGWDGSEQEIIRNECLKLLACAVLKRHGIDVTIASKEERR